MILPINTDS